MKVKFESSGLYTTIQDMGRMGHQHHGIPIGGALDSCAYQLANELVGNSQTSPTLEITLIGPKMSFDTDGVIAICGANLSAQINNSLAPIHQAIKIEKGDVLTFGKPISGCRAYLAIQGNWDVNTWLGSSSPIKSSNILNENIMVKSQEITINSLDKKPAISKTTIIKPKTLTFPIAKGPEIASFDHETISSLEDMEFEVSNQINRMGIQLVDRLKNYKDPIEVISSGIIPGTIQITHDGRPIILLADAQTTGGYPRIANIRESAIDQLAQLAPKDRIKFYWN